MSLKRLMVLASMLTCIGCDSQPPEIRTACQRDAVGNYIIKWETHPEMSGLMQLYVSDYPDMSKSVWAGYTNISDGVRTYVTNDNIGRKYFRLVFNNIYETTVSSRSVLLDSVTNFRDLGGYQSSDGHAIKWGKVFRSADISHLSERDMQRLDKLKIRTIIDLRTEAESKLYPVTLAKSRIVSVPILSDIDPIIRQIMDERVRKGDVSLIMQDMYLRFTESTQPLSEALPLFLDEDNYPVLFICQRGKDRVGFLSALLLAALDVPEKTILDDYTDVNNYIDLSRYSALVRQIDANGQEAMTVALSANENFLGLAFRKMKKENGSVDNYLSEKLKITEKQKEKLKAIMLF